MAQHIPFDYCDECGQKCEMDRMVVVGDYYFCEECYGETGGITPYQDERDAEEASRIEDAREGFES